MLTFLYLWGSRSVCFLYIWGSRNYSKNMFLGSLTKKETWDISCLKMGIVSSLDSSVLSILSMFHQTERTTEKDLQVSFCPIFISGLRSKHCLLEGEKEKLNTDSNINQLSLLVDFKYWLMFTSENITLLWKLHYDSYLA